MASSFSKQRLRWILSTPDAVERLMALTRDGHGFWTGLVLFLKKNDEMQKKKKKKGYGRAG
ncbi:hypothetical protein C1H46_036976 [Malus baccata]|uniref:Uncharacterized protein n=1 Tax=Malus baccata TaxID=106549 RepID=A0A540KTD9_MALBA|nr:hypothetical protein C1H46_036976 [Malus baccata]